MRIALCLLLGAFAGIFTHGIAAGSAKPRDFAQVWFAARTLLAGGDPYAAVGPGLAFDWPAPLFYPMPAVLLAVPLAPLPAPLAAGFFAGLGMAAFAWALSRQGLGPLLGLLSASAVFSLETVQWAPVLAASLVLPPLGALLVAKPTIGAAFFATRPGWWAVAGGAGLLALSFAVQPDWLSSWRGALAPTRMSHGEGFAYVPPLLMPGGMVALACLLRWRRWEARLVLALACVPQTLLLYETVPLLLVARSWRGAAVLVTASWAALYWITHGAPYATLAAYLAASGRILVPLMYVPATLLVLRYPNEGPAPAWLERAVSRAPRWLRGSPTPITKTA